MPTKPPTIGESPTAAGQPLPLAADLPVVAVGTEQDRTDVIAAHFDAENRADLPAILATYTDDVRWEDTTQPIGPLRGKQAAATAYANLLSVLTDMHLESVWRIETASHVVDESIVTGRVIGTIGGVAGEDTVVCFRLLHVFELRDGLISAETAWYDAGGLVRQISAASAPGASIPAG